jgi:hypothetical protein
MFKNQHHIILNNLIIVNSNANALLVTVSYLKNTKTII